MLRSNRPAVICAGGASTNPSVVLAIRMVWIFGFHSEARVSLMLLASPRDLLDT